MVVREKLQMCRWMASKLIPIYGDKQQIIQDTKIEISWNNQDPDLKNVTESSVLSMNK